MSDEGAVLDLVLFDEVFDVFCEGSIIMARVVGRFAVVSCVLDHIVSVVWRAVWT